MWYEKTAMVLAAIGAINWGLVAIGDNWNLVELIFGSWPIVVTILYALVGLSGIWALIKVFK